MTPLGREEGNTYIQPLHFSDNRGRRRREGGG